MSRCLVAVLLLFALAPATQAFSSGPPEGRTGAPGEETCNSVGCHSSFPLNDGDVTLQLLDAGGANLTEYAPGELIALGFRLSSAEAGRGRWGFEMTSLDADLQRAGEYALGVDAGVGVSLVADRTYVKQLSAGLGDLQPDGNEWSFLWQAPPAGTGTVTMHACGNAADRSLNALGDWIECAGFTLSEISQAADRDGDGVVDLLDNCVVFANPLQADGNGDGLGDACDLDWADVAPAGALDGVVDVSDVIRLLRFAVRLEDVAGDDEFRRANVSPATLTDGAIPVATPTLADPQVVDVGDVILALRASVTLVSFSSPF